MSISSIELWQRVVAEGIASPMQCRSWAAEVAKNLPAADTADGLKVLQQLIDIGKLTKYQAKSLAGQSIDPLKRGPWNVLNRVKVPQFQGWLEVTKIDTSKGEQPPLRWMRWLKAQDLESLRASAPSLPRGIQLAQIRHPHLQPVEMPEMIDGELQLQVAPVSGASLATSFATDRPTAEQTQLIIEQVGQALAAMHEKRVVHGRVLPDRIFWEATQGATLICDPISVWTASVEQTAGGILGEHMNAVQVASFMAPEFLAPRQPPSMASDIYALGATWWWLLTGKAIAEGKNVASTLGQAAEVALDFRDQSIQLPEPIKICLQFCLAKNPSARLGSAVQLVEAMNAAKRSLAKGKVPKTAAPTSLQAVKSAATKPIQTEAVLTTTSVAVTVSDVLTPTVTPRMPGSAPASNTASEPTTPTLVAPANALVADAPTKRQKSASNSSSTGKSAKAGPQTPSETIKSKAAIGSPTTSGGVVKDTRVESGVAEGAAVKDSVVEPDVVRTFTNETSAIESQVFADVYEARPNELTTSEARPVSSLAVADTGTTLAGSTTKKSNLATSPTITNQPAANSKPIARRKTKRKSKMPLLVISGFGFLAVILGILKLSGALDKAGKKEVAENKGTFQPSVNISQPTIITKDPILDHFKLVDNKEAAWAPPQIPSPIELDMLPPGAQLYIALRPADLLNGKSASLTATLSKQFGFDQLLAALAKPTGQTANAIHALTVAFYSAPAPEQMPQFAVRVELASGVSIDQLRTSWGSTTESVVGQERLLTGQQDLAYFVPKEADSSKVEKFSLGPSALMKEVAEMSGGATALNPQFKQLHLRTSRNYPLVMLGSPRYLFTEGRGLVKAIPQRLQQQIEPVFGKDSRAGLVQTNFGDQWYWELQLLGPTEAESPRLMNNLHESASTASTQVEQWLFDQTPHPYWRALALRFPQMIRTWREYARFSMEDGAAIANGYLPANAANNLLVTCWIAAQESSTFAGQLATNTPTTNAAASPSMSAEDLLNKPIRLIFDQEPIEKALALVGEEANAGLAAADQLRFELDGGAFERAGITRNQQLRDYKIENRPVREALTEIAKRGNPVTTVKDTRETDQRLIWVVRDDPKNPGRKMISLTTRETAKAEKIQLSKEFAQ